jgi:hypothetical protein
VEAVEREQALKRADSGRRALGRYAVLRQSWRESPTSREPRRGLRPTIAARSLWTRIEAIQRKRAFVAAYRVARAALSAGTRVPFPYGTYWMCRVVKVEIAAVELN